MKQVEKGYPKDYKKPSQMEQDVMDTLINNDAGDKVESDDLPF